MGVAVVPGFGSGTIAVARMQVLWDRKVCWSCQQVPLLLLLQHSKTIVFLAALDAPALVAAVAAVPWSHSGPTLQQRLKAQLGK